ncbi:MAG: helix-turn-helix transcriptional regulator [Planctomycetales bacterium]
MARPSVTVKGKRFVLVEPAELRRLERMAARAEAANELPGWPPADAAGNRPAVAFARASIARSIIEERKTLGLTQAELAKLAGVRQETVSRLESGKHSPTVRTVEKIERALQRCARRRGSI